MRAETEVSLNSEFAYGASLSAHGHIILLYSRFSDELNAPKGKRRIRTLSRDSALFLPRGGPARRVPDAHGTILQISASVEQMPVVGSEFAYGASLSAHGHIILLYS
ncbi:MAG: hypothetical protein OXP09_12470, partial [Gammaproteobacteria bacterium]|nr:hypothetical protein [Gammaproteobacteria bacterium]MDE0366376.1 hypothetical protein [Gammaproteobacteria bacterium]